MRITEAAALANRYMAETKGRLMVPPQVAIVGNTLKSAMRTERFLRQDLDSPIYTGIFTLSARYSALAGRTRILVLTEPGIELPPLMEDAFTQTMLYVSELMKIDPKTLFVPLEFDHE